MPMAISPDRRFLFAALRSEPYSVASYAIDPTSGKLKYLASSPLPLSALYLATDREGRFLLSVSIPESKARRTSIISVSDIDRDGCVQPPRQRLRAEPKVHSVMFDPSGRFVFAACCLSDYLLRYRFDNRSGAIADEFLPPVRVIPKAGPRHFVFHPSNRYLYLLNETDATIYAFAYDAQSGGLSELQIVEATPPEFSGGERMGADIHITPDGQFLYASERATHTLAAFKVDVETGSLSRIGNFATEQRPRGFNIDPSGRYLLCAGQESNRLSSYSIDAESGVLHKIGEYPMGRAPNWVEITRLL